MGFGSATMKELNLDVFLKALHILVPTTSAVKFHFT